MQQIIDTGMNRNEKQMNTWKMESTLQKNELRWESKYHLSSNKPSNHVF